MTPISFRNVDTAEESPFSVYSSTDYLGNLDSIGCYVDKRGSLYIPAAGNGRYEHFHQIMTTKEENCIGYLTGGSSKLGYTYYTVYSDFFGKFLVAHVPFNSQKGYISSLAVTGKRILYRKGLIFDKTMSLELGNSNDWVISGVKARLNEHGFFWLSRNGMCMIDTSTLHLRYKVIFENNRANYPYEWAYSAAFSPKTDIVAVLLQNFLPNNPIDGSSSSHYLIRIYDYTKGELLGTHSFDKSVFLDERRIDFEKDGRRIRVFGRKSINTNNAAIIFEMKA